MYDKNVLRYLDRQGGPAIRSAGRPFDCRRIADPETDHMTYRMSSFRSRAFGRPAVCACS